MVYNHFHIMASESVTMSWTCIQIRQPQSLDVCCVISVGGNELKINQTTNTYGSMPSFITNKAALIRSTYVFGGLCFLAILYFIFRTCRLRRRRGSAGSRRTGTRKYRPLHTGAGIQEMEPLGGGDNEDEDEDTLFETSQSPSAVRPNPWAWICHC